MRLRELGELNLTTIEETCIKYPLVTQRLLNLKPFLNKISQPHLNKDAIELSQQLNCSKFQMIYIPNSMGSLPMGENSFWTH